MPRDSGGTYTLPAGNPVVSGTVIASSWANTTMDDVAIEMTDSLSRTGNGAMQAALKHIDGAETSPSQTFNNDPLTGRYLAAVSDMRDTVAGVDKMRLTAAGLEVWIDPDWVPVIYGDGGYKPYKKNLWINGNFGVTQRPQPYTAQGYGPDRCFLYGPTSSSVLADAVYGHKLNLDGSAAVQGIELDVQGIGAPMTVGKTFTLSFKCLCDGATTIDILGIFRDKVGDGTNSEFEPNATADLGVGIGVFKEFSHTFTMSVAPQATNLTFEMYIGATGGVAQFVEIQLEENTVATSFEYVSAGDNLAACQRYYQSVASCTIPAASNATNNRVAWVNFATTMRAVPSTFLAQIVGDAPTAQDQPKIDGFRVRWNTGQSATQTQVDSWIADAEL